LISERHEYASQAPEFEKMLKTLY
jgi:hypothetical protein